MRSSAILTVALALAGPAVAKEGRGFSRFSAELEHTPFLGGSYETLAVRMSYSKGKFSIGLRGPFHILNLDAATEPRTGLGDLGLELRIRPFKLERIGLYFGAAVELPIGSTVNGVGSGHIELQPLLGASFGVGGVSLFTRVGDHISLSGDTPHGLGPPVNPHAENELRWSAGASTGLGSGFWGEVALDGTTVISGTQEGTTFMVVNPQIELSVTPEMDLTLGAQVPVPPEKRFDWKLNAGLQVNVF